MQQHVLKIHPQDNIAVALSDLSAGESLQVGNQWVVLTEDIPAKHKFALTDFSPGESVFMYGVLIGRATQPIQTGGIISIENIQHAAAPAVIGERKLDWKKPDISDFDGMEFLGYHRNDGQVGTANYWLVIPLVFCQNRNLDVMKHVLLETLGYENNEAPYDISNLMRLYEKGASTEDILNAELEPSEKTVRQNRFFPNVDGIKFLTHEGGCGGTREDAETLCRLFAGYLNNANVAGATVLSLGCQHAEVPLLEKAVRQMNPNFDKPLYILTQQESTSESAFLAEALKKTFAGLMDANRISRKPAPLSKLKIGLECGGSDGFSGISANPVLGYASDLIITLGGTAILSEFPELNGVEQELADRCQTEKLAEKFIQLMQRYNEKAEAVGSGFAANPSPGNIKDGLITDAMKSAGAAKKGGTSSVADVLDYTEQAVNPGLNLLCTPGNDVESTTGLAGSGANIILFTTGLGTPTGNPVSPVLKVATNTAVFQKMGDILDFNTGEIITGDASIEEKGRQLLELIIETASGKYQAKAERLGQDDFIPWKRGVSL